MPRANRHQVVVVRSRRRRHRRQKTSMIFVLPFATGLESESVDQISLTNAR